jgi:head-tail adaptor
MRAGNLDRQIEITRTTTTANPDEPWIPGDETTVTVATARAQLVQQSTEEFLRNFGEQQVAAVIFRIRYIAGIVLTDRVVYAGATYDLEEIKEIGRRKGLELRAKVVT